MSVVRKVCLGVLMAAAVAQSGFAQKSLTWEDVRAKFEAVNPTLRAGQIGVDESHANETTAYLRPNPNMTLLMDPNRSLPRRAWTWSVRVSSALGDLLVLA